MIQNRMRSYARGTKAALVIEIGKRGCTKRTFVRETAPGRMAGEESGEGHLAEKKTARIQLCRQTEGHACGASYRSAA